MSKNSKNFEKIVHRIHELIEQPGSQVIWNDHVRDPDNPKQSRQIDISIRRRRKITYIECRTHRSKQDVCWIEELIGRRQSLKADAMIAVSACGFTSGAVKKAEKHGIILRDLISLSDDEIKAWGKSTKLWLTFYQYSDTLISLEIDLSKTKAATILELKRLIENENALHKIFGLVKIFLNKRNLADHPKKLANVNYIFEFASTEFQNISLKKATFKSKVIVLTKKILTPSVIVYDEPHLSALKRSVFIERAKIGESEITQSSRKASAVVDLSHVKTPKNSQFNSIRFDFVDPISFRNIYLIGFKDYSIPMNSLKVKIKSVL
ncbi:MAG: restriction endonuclease [Desulfobacterales bacterium]|jgi:hypothetical protein|nr:restriction endonuclease [Desulfobacterales bacterium]